MTPRLAALLVAIGTAAGVGGIYVAPPTKEH